MISQNRNFIKIIQKGLTSPKKDKKVKLTQCCLTFLIVAFPLFQLKLCNPYTTTRSIIQRFSFEGLSVNKFDHKLSFYKFKKSNSRLISFWRSYNFLHALRWIRRCATCKRWICRTFRRSFNKCLSWLIRRVSFTRRQEIKRVEIILFTKSFTKPSQKRKFA